MNAKCPYCWMGNWVLTATVAFASLLCGASTALSAAAKDDTTVLRAAVETLRDGGTLKLERREYRLTPQGAKKMWLAPSNNTTGEKNVIFPIVGKKDVTIDGNGATLVFDGDVFPFAVLGSRGVTIRNLTITKPNPVIAALTVTAADEKGFTIAFTSGAVPTVQDGELVFDVDGFPLSTRTGLLAIHAMDKFRVHYLLTPAGDRAVAHWDHNTFPSTYSPVTAEALDGTRFYLRYRDADKGIRLNKQVPYAVGRPLGINLYPRRNVAFFLEDAADARIENVTIRRFGGMGVVAQRSENLTYDGIRMVPQKGDSASTSADMFQVINCCGRVRIENCEGSDSMDDAINIHGNYMGVKSWDGAQLVLKNFRDRGKPSDDDRYGFFPVRVGDELSFLRDADRHELGRARVKAVVTRDDSRVCAETGVAPTMTVTLEGVGEFPKTLPADTLVENMTLYPDVVFRNNRFTHYPHLRFSGRGKYLIEGNRLENALAAFLIHDLKDYWYESGPVEDMTIRNNTFTDCNAQGGSAFITICPCGWNGHGRMGRVVLEGNRYEKVKNKRVSAWNVENLIDRDAPGAVPPLNEAGQPPMPLGEIGWGPKMFHYLPEAGIRHARLHDTGGAYGGGKFVDISNLFRDFKADENDPKSYDFTFTDELLKAMVTNGIAPFFRLGETIENHAHIRRYRTFVPPDKAKWARICEHVIRHYNEGWADGFRFGIEYWEIWNEPDFTTEAWNPMWTGTAEDFYDLYEVTAKHLKKCFPHLRIGGYGSCGFWAITSEERAKREGKDARSAERKAQEEYHVAFFRNFLKRVKAKKIPFDFFTFHSYSSVGDILRQVEWCCDTMKAESFGDVELNLDEWLPAPTLEKLGTARQAAEIAAVLAGATKTRLGRAMIYDARCGIGNYSPLFNPMTYRPHKAYYTFVAFEELRKLGCLMATPATPDGVYVAAATDGGSNAAALVANVSGKPWRTALGFADWEVAEARAIDESRTYESAAWPVEIGDGTAWLVKFRKRTGK